MIATYRFLTYCSSFISLEAPLRISKQGLYFVVLFNSNWKCGFRVCVGSSWGQQGLKYRIFKNHANVNYRNSPIQRTEYLYDLMAEPGTTWKFVCLAIFEETVPKQLVLIAEGIMCSLFLLSHMTYIGNFVCLVSRLWIVNPP